MLHGALLFCVVAGLPFARDSEPAENRPIPVEMVTPSELTKLKAGKKDTEKEAAAAVTPPEPPKPEKKEAKKEPVQPRRVAAPPPAPKPADAEPAPKPEKKAEPKPEKKAEKVAEKPSGAPMPSRRPKPPAVSRPIQREETKVAAKTPAKKKPTFDADRIAALLDKRPDAGAPEEKAEPEPDASERESARGRAEGRDQRMSISEIDALRARISQCWSPPVGGLGSDAIRVKIRMQLKRDGMLAEQPQVVNRDGSPFFAAAADSAVRAVMLCQPYSLPGEKFALWRDMILNFDPREMFGG